MTSYTVQQLFADYSKVLTTKAENVNSDPWYQYGSYPRSVDSRTCQYQQFLDKFQNNKNQQYDVASINGIIIENNYLKYSLQKAQTMELYDLLDIKTESFQSQRESAISEQLSTSKGSSIGDGEVGLQEADIPKDFLNDFLYLMEATKHLPIRTQNIVVLHFASECRERMNQQILEQK